MEKVFANQAAGAWTIRLAAGQGWHGLFDAGVAIDALRRDRLATAAADLDAGAGGIVDK